MVDNWKDYKLSDIINLVGGGTPKTTIPEYWNGSIPWLSVVDFNNDFRKVYKTQKTITSLGLKNSSTKILKKGQLIISARGTVGAIAQLGCDMAFNQSCFGIDGIPDFVTNDFLYYLIQFIINDLQRITHGAVFDTINRDTFKYVNVKIPPLPEQKQIAHILGTLDDKIELNQRMNRTLEAIARAIFKSWFIDFDPVRAKMEGRQPEGMSKEVADLFPDSFVDSQLGMIPKGWEVGTITDCCYSISNGGTPKKNIAHYWQPKEISWLTSGEVRQEIIIGTNNKISKIGLQNSSAKVWKKGTTVIALYGATAGEVTLLGIDLCANQACSGLAPKKGMRLFNYLYLSKSKDLLAIQARGSAQQNLSKQIVSSFPTIIPSQEITNQFEKELSPFFDKWVLMIEQTYILSAMRDTLLPKLISGEIRIKEAEKILEKAV